MADMHLPVTVHEIPSDFFFQPDGALRDRFKYFVGIGVLRVIAGPQMCRAIVDVKRPYFLPIPNVHQHKEPTP